MKLFVPILRYIILIIILWTTYLLLPLEFQTFDNKLKDFLFLANQKRIDKSKSIVIVDIDEKSLEKYGQWPWSRGLIAELIKNLRDYGVGVIGLDIIFSEIESRSKKIQNSLCPDEGDKLLSEAFRSSPVIGGYFFMFNSKTSSAQKPSLHHLTIVEKGEVSDYIPSPKSIKLNIPCIDSSLYSSGFFNNIPDKDGVVRRIPLLMRYKEILYPSLTLEMIRVFEGVEEIVVNSTKNGVVSIEVGSRKIAVDRFGNLIINFRGASKTFRYISAKDILDKSVSESDLKGKFALLGTSSLGLSDIKPTPTDSLMPGVEIHANVIDNLLHLDMISSSVNIEIIDLMIISLTVVFGAMIGYLFNGWLIFPSFAVILYGFYAVAKYIFLDLRVDVNIFIPLIALFTSIFITIILRYLHITQEMKELERAFSKKVSSAVMKDILQNSKRDVLSSKEREITVLFSDIRAFTTISESIKNPKEIVSLLNDYFDPMVDSITSHQGTVDKFIGDAIMAYWNAPTTLSNHPDEAVSSAVEQLEALKEINLKIQEQKPYLYSKILKAVNRDIDEPKLRYNQALNIGIGINSSVATVGEMGSTGRSDYTIIGDGVNLASRLESLSKIYGASIIISQYTKEMLQKEYSLRELDFVKVKGKREAIAIYEILDFRLSQKELESYYKALSLYRSGKFKRAIHEFDKLYKNSTHSYKLYKMFRERCIYLFKNPPKEWRGVFEFNIK